MCYSAAPNTTTFGRRRGLAGKGPQAVTEASIEKQYVQRATRFMLNTGQLMYLAEATELAWLELIAPSSERLPTAPAVTPAGMALPSTAPTRASARHWYAGPVRW
ncbi:hypothetical protein Asppvi_007091 [Aspergillus pseudoviridinutans]|uniref:Uncharacterized protein n=1 Tax=Aspergillus pseudoviridinutans TaxID=1517512 RepID=A0A9P3BH16_9EURO|nr:uncharacterized protein Asppvi_007091 [Aspergillus pseudoviridinutans]GIJ88173.1 hypothetical protein Asppvi_007091 [Aspergillus pseudoviridinutans]